MRAHVGDWIAFPVGGHARRGRIVAVPDPEGHPPYRVRWLDDDRETVLVPPPDAVLTCRTPLAASADRKE
jgi:hypothetical protein